MVVVVTYQSARVLPDFLRSLAAGLDGLAWRLVVADNDSRDGGPELVAASMPGATILRLGRNAGFAAGVNAGVAAAGPRAAVLVCNPDVRLHPHAGRRLLAALDRDGVGIAVPRLHGDDGRLQHSLRREPSVARALGEALLGSRAGRVGRLGEVVGTRRPYGQSTVADWATGALLLISRACLDAVGPWDEDYFLYGEEVDFALRARDAGFAVRLVPEAGAVHVGGDLQRDPSLWALMVRNRVALFRRRHGLAASWAYLGATALGEWLRIPRHPRHRVALQELRRRRWEPGPDTGLPGYVCFSAQDWWYHNRAHSDIQLMREIARTRTVVLVNSIGMRMPIPGRSSEPLRRILRKARSTTRLLRRPVPELPGFHVFSAVIVPFYGNATARRANAWLVRTQVRIVLRLLGISEPVVVVTIPTAVDVVRGLPHRRLLYNRSDRHGAFPEAPAMIAELEAELLDTADQVLYVSHALMDAESDRVGRRAHFLDHGVDVGHFRPRDRAELPADLTAIPRPRMGFFGGLDDYVVDFDLLKRLALELPDASLVLIGDATVPMTPLTALPNVHWLGQRDYAEIPRYGSGFDVALMPWLDNDWIRACNPIKLKEYLALGLPTVSTDFPEVRRYAGHVRVAADADAFIEQVKSALRAEAEPGSRRVSRRAAVLSDTWSARAVELVALAECEASEAAPLLQTS